MLVVPDEGELVLMAALQTFLNGGSPKLRLYQNNMTPSDSDVIGDFVEADFDGYAEVILVTWTVPIMVGGRAFISEAMQVFQASGGVTPNDIYGYYMINNAETAVLWAERFAGAPIVIDGLGDSVTVTPSLTLRSEP